MPKQISGAQAIPFKYCRDVRDVVPGAHNNGSWTRTRTWTMCGLKMAGISHGNHDLCSHANLSFATRQSDAKGKVISHGCGSELAHASLMSSTMHPSSHGYLPGAITNGTADPLLLTAWAGKRWCSQWNSCTDLHEVFAATYLSCMRSLRLRTCQYLMEQADGLPEGCCLSLLTRHHQTP